MFVFLVNLFILQENPKAWKDNHLTVILILFLSLYSVHIIPSIVGITSSIIYIADKIK